MTSRRPILRRGVALGALGALALTGSLAAAAGPASAAAPVPTTAAPTTTTTRAPSPTTVAPTTTTTRPSPTTVPAVPATVAPTPDDLNAPVSPAGRTAPLVAAGGSLDPAGSAPFAGRSSVGTESVPTTGYRVRINPTTTYPARATVAIEYPGSATCTGFLIGPSTVITSGSCVAGLRTWRSPAQFRVVPGKNGAVEPYGACGVTSIATVVGWFEYLSPEYNYGSLQLDCTIGNTVGWYGYFWTNQYGMNNIPMNVNGYPSDVFPGTQFKTVGRTTVTDDRRVYYSVQVVGQPGSPVWTPLSRPTAGPYAFGINGYTGPPNWNLSSGVKINRWVFRNLYFWKYGYFPPS